MALEVRRPFRVERRRLSPAISMPYRPATAAVERERCHGCLGCLVTGGRKRTVALKLEDAKAELIARVSAVARDRVPGPQAAELAMFIQQYSARVPPDDLLEI